MTTKIRVRDNWDGNEGKLLTTKGETWTVLFPNAPTGTAGAMEYVVTPEQRAAGDYEVSAIPFLLV